MPLNSLQRHPQAMWPQRPDKVEAILKDFAPDVGDRRQELVFIGVGLRRAALVAALDACLVTDAELAASAALPDPFAAWPSIAEMLGMGSGARQLCRAAGSLENVIGEGQLLDMILHIAPLCSTLRPQRPYTCFQKTRAARHHCYAGDACACGDVDKLAPVDIV